MIRTNTALAALVPPSMSTSNNSSSNSVPDTSSGLTLMAQSSGGRQRDALYAVLRGVSLILVALSKHLTSLRKR